LPSEAEWNYAVAGGNQQRTYPWGETEPGANANLAVYSCRYNGSGTCTGVTNIAPVGSVPAGNGRYGQSDLAGNLWEWTLDWYASPYLNPCNNCSYVQANAADRVPRGGGFNTDAPYLSFRGNNTPTSRNNYLAARCARSAP
jgi:formylglycine-generating enzyme required for sulfatase activity